MVTIWHLHQQNKNNGLILYAKSTSSKAYATEQVDTNGDFSITRVFPDVSFDSESSKENQLDIRYLSRNDRKQRNEWV